MPIDSQPIVKQDIDLNIFVNTMIVKPENIRSIPGVSGFIWIIANDVQV